MDAAAESKHNQADAFGWATSADADVDVDAVEPPLERACRERESVGKETTESIVGVSRHDVENPVNHQRKRAATNEDDQAVVPEEGQSVAAALVAIDEGDQATLASEASVRAVAGAEAGA